MRIVTFEVRMPLPVLRQEIRYTLLRLRGRPFGKAFVKVFEGLLKETETAMAAEQKLLDALEDADANVDEADWELDRLAARIAKQVRVELSGERLSTFVRALFGTQKPSQFVRPKLGKEWEAVKAWPAVLADAPTAALKAEQGTVEKVLKACGDADSARKGAQAALAAFAVSTHSVLVEKVNGQRKLLSGEAAKQVHEAAAFEDEGEGLFRASARSRLSLAVVEKELAQAEGEVQRLKARQAELVAEQAAQAKEEEEAVERERKLAELERQKEETEKAMAALMKATGRPKAKGRK
jgi:hypothetical protein